METGNETKRNRKKVRVRASSEQLATSRLC